MNADRLFALYDRVADAPDAVGRLRRFVLDLGVRGKLVEQDPADEPASGLSELIGQDEINDLGFLGNWCRVTVGDTLDFLYGKGLKASDRADDGPVPVYGSNGIVGYTTEPLTVRPSVIVGRKGSAGALNKCNGPSWTTDVAYYVEMPDFFDLDFLFFSLATLDLSDLAKGVKPGLSRADAYSKLISVPPLAEQRRIVAKVDDLMALCDRLEEARTVREDTHDRLTKASLARLSAADTDVPTFRSHARFAVDALPALTARADQVKHLRQTILSLAVRGRLVEQDPEDEPASELLQRTEKPPLPARYAKRSPESIPGDCGLSINRPEIPSPPGWLWVPLVQVARIESGHTPSRSRADWWGGDVPWMGLVDARLHNDGRIFNTIQHTNEAGLANSAARLLPEGTVCFSRTASVGYVVIMGRPMATSQDFVNWVPTEALAPEWLQLVMMAERPAIPRFSKGAVHQTIYYPAWLAMHVALPPLAEQHRIVAEIDALMALCDHMEAGLAAADATRSRLLESLLHAALASAASRTLSMDRPFSSRHPSVRGGLSRLAHSDRIDE